MHNFFWVWWQNEKVVRFYWTDGKKEMCKILARPISDRLVSQGRDLTSFFPKLVGIGWGLLHVWTVFPTACRQLVLAGEGTLEHWPLGRAHVVWIRWWPLRTVRMATQLNQDTIKLKGNRFKSRSWQGYFYFKSLLNTSWFRINVCIMFVLWTHLYKWKINLIQWTKRAQGRARKVWATLAKVKKIRAWQAM